MSEKKYGYIKISQELKEEYENIDINGFKMTQEQTMLFLLDLYKKYKQDKSEK